MNSSRSQINWISALLYVLMVVVFLVSPFYSIFTVGITGMNLINIHALAIIPVLLGIVAAIAACFFPPVIAIVLEIAYALFMVLFMFQGNSIAASIVNSGLSVPTEWASSMTTVLSLTAMVRPGWGAILCLAICIAAIVIDALICFSNLGQSRQQPTFTHNDDFFPTGRF